MSAQTFVTFTRMDFGFHPNEQYNVFNFPLEALAAELAGPARVLLAYERYIHKGQAQRRARKLDPEFQL